jgi:hypothetical protein
LLELVDIRQELDLLLQAGDVGGRSGLSRGFGINELVACLTLPCSHSAQELDQISAQYELLLAVLNGVQPLALGFGCCLIPPTQPLLQDGEGKNFVGVNAAARGRLLGWS